MPALSIIDGPYYDPSFHLTQPACPTRPVAQRAFPEAQPKPAVAKIIVAISAIEQSEHAMPAAVFEVRSVLAVRGLANIAHSKNFNGAPGTIRCTTSRKNYHGESKDPIIST